MTQTVPTTIVDEQGNHIDPTSGEVVEEETGLTVINPADPENMLPTIDNIPPHFRALNLEAYPESERTERVLMATEYLGAPKELIEYVNMDIDVRGAALIWHPPFAAKGSKPGDPLSPGFFNSRLMLTDGTLLKSSSMNVSQTLAGLIPVLGWFDWSTPITFHVTAKDGAHYISRVKKAAKK